MARVPTRERILETALRLFNDEGEPRITTVDIAGEMDISPGNLYYHFKGKEALIDALYDRFEHHFSELLQAPSERPLNAEEHWFYLYVLFEEIYRFRFFYRNLTDLLHRYPLLRKRFRRLLELKRRRALDTCRELAASGVLQLDADALNGLADSLVLTLTWFLTQEELRHSDSTAPIHQGVYRLLQLITPFVASEHRHWVDDGHELYAHFLASGQA